MRTPVLQCFRSPIWASLAHLGRRRARSSSQSWLDQYRLSSIGQIRSDLAQIWLNPRIETPECPEFQEKRVKISTDRREGGGWLALHAAAQSGGIISMFRAPLILAFYTPRKWGGHLPTCAIAQMGIFKWPRDPNPRVTQIPSDFWSFWQNRQTKPFRTSETPKIGLATRILYRKDRRSAHTVHS